MTVLDLPEQMTTPEVTLSAHLERGCRGLSWMIPTPGELARNSYVWAWIDVHETDPWRGDRLWLSATRRTGDGYSRVPFTDRGRAALHARIVPQLARCFAEMWEGLHRAKTSVGSSLVAEAEARLAWARAQRDLASMHRDGLIEFRRADRRNVLAVVLGRTEMVEVSASAWLEGVQVGWMDRRGDLIPHEELLR